MIRSSLCNPKIYPITKRYHKWDVQYNIQGDKRNLYEVAKRLFPLIFFPYLKKIYGNGIMPTVKKASRLVAH